MNIVASNAASGVRDAGEVGPELAERLEHNFAQVNGVRLHYVSAGKGDLLLFAHGFPSFWYTWRNQLAEFGRDHLAVAPDMRGYNLSSKPAAAPHYRLPIIVEDLRALVEHLGYDRFTLVGNDWGGLLAWTFALHHPEMLDKLIILSSPHPACFERELRENPVQQEASQYLLGLRTPGSEDLLAVDDYQLLADNVLDFPFYTDHDRACYRRSWSQPGGLTGALGWYRAAWLGPPADDGIAPHGNYVPEIINQEVRVPTLVIKAEGCPYFLSGTLDGLDAYVPDLTLRRLPSQSHSIAEEQPEAVNRHIREFLDR
jgi:epoxide hydrolase 4